MSRVNLSIGFKAAYRKMSQLVDGLAAGENGQDTRRTRIVVKCFQEFSAKWLPLVSDPKLPPDIHQAQARIESLRLKLERIYLAQLHAVIEHRKVWFMAFTIFKNIETLPVFPQKIHALENEAAKTEMIYRRALVSLSFDWPGRVDPDLTSRLETLDFASALRWQEELMAQSAMLENELAMVAAITA